MIIITDERIFTPSLCVAGAELTETYTYWGCGDLASPVFHKALTPGKEVDYYRLDYFF